MAFPINKFTSRDIQRILDVLGSTKMTFWPFMAGGAGSHVGSIGTSGVLSSTTDESAVRTIESEFGPLLLPSGLFAYHFTSAANQHIKTTDSAEHSFGDGSTDGAFSVGMWIQPGTKSDNTLMAKYDATAAEEWKWGLASTTGAMYLELYDASANASEIGTADGAQAKEGSDGSPDLFKWSFVVTTYDGTETAPKITHYIDSHDVSNANRDSAETSTYTAMENTATPLLIGASELTAAPDEEYNGYIALPFITGKELTTSEVSQLYEITQKMVGR